METRWRQRRPFGSNVSLRAGARQKGAEIYLFTTVTGTFQQLDGSWIVETPHRNIHSQWVVNAAGLWGREVAHLAGIDLPLQPTEHQYFVTDKIPDIANMDRRLPSVADRDGEYYLRQEGQGLLVGAYERNFRFWAEDKTSLDFGHELFENGFERIDKNILRSIDSVPVIVEASIKCVINGPMIW